MLKSIAVLMLLVVTCSFSCRKSGMDTGIYGSWQLVRVTGGLAGVDMTASEWGHSKSYIFNENGKCVTTLDNTTSRSGFTISRDTSYFTGKLADFVTINGNYGERYEFMVARDTLMMAADVRADGMIEWYTRR